MGVVMETNHHVGLWVDFLWFNLLLPNMGMHAKRIVDVIHLQRALKF
jgi:hypothetical protein